MSARIGNKNASGNKGGARKTDYSEEYPEQAEKLCKLGATDKEIAEFFNVTERTINNWKKAHIEFFSALKKGKIIADAEIANKLYQRAYGYQFNEVTFEKIDGKVTLEITSAADIVSNDAYKKKVVVKEIPPDVTAQIFWLKNRQKLKWRDKQDFGIIDFENMPETLLDEIIKRLTQKHE